jgi:Arc/MetJ-type ribon-helix-helix transcriptional regulator
MNRTQVYLTDDLKRDLKLETVISRKSQSEVIREALQRGLKQMAQERPNTAKGLRALVELGERLKIQGPPDLSANIDKYLYEDD